MTEHKHPDDGGPYSLPTDKATEVRFAQPVDYYRFKAVLKFAAAWLPLMLPETKGVRFEAAGERANELGLAMADDLIRRMREGS